MSHTTREDASELRELGNALAVVSVNVRHLLRRLPSWADRRERRALVAIRDGLLRAGRLLRPATGGIPPARCDLQAVVWPWPSARCRLSALPTCSCARGRRRP